MVPVEEQRHMAIDPVQSVQAHRHEVAIDRDLRRPLQRMAAFLPSPDVPYLTARIDWRPDGTQPNSRPGRDVIGRKLDEVVAAQDAHTPASAALTHARDAIVSYLDNEIDPAVQGVYIVAGGEENVFEPLALGLPLETELELGPVPVLTPLARFVEDNPPFAVLVADQREATLTIVDQSYAAGELVIEGSEFPRKQMQGGWSQRRYQMRADERIATFARTVAEETQRVLEVAGIEQLVISGDEVITPELDAAWHQKYRERIVGHIRLENRATQADAVAKALPIAEKAARAREEAAVRLLANNAGGPLAVSGIEQTLLALQEERVMNLVVAEDFHADGWADYTMPIAGAGAPSGQHPAGGDPAAMIPIALEEELIRLALAQDATIEIVHATVPIEEVADGPVPQAGDGPPRMEAARMLDEMGGVGAILRYAFVDSGPAMPEAQ